MSRNPSRLASFWIVAWAIAFADVAAHAQTITTLPMLLTMRGTEMWLQWETNSDPGSHFVDFGEASVAEQTVASSETIALDATHFMHRAVLSGLTPDTTYFYRVRSGATQSAEFSFRTAPVLTGPPEATAFRMAWIADNQNQAGTSFAGVLAEIVPFAVDFIGHAGDTVQNDTNLNQWQFHWYAPLASTGLGQTTPVLVARGNHDDHSSNSLANHWLPNGGHWYSQRVGRVFFLFLDTNDLGSPAQDDFIAAELASPAAQNADFRIAVYHIPGHTNLWCNSGFNGDATVRGDWIPLFEQYGVDLVVNGHAHAYERGELNGITYTIVGGAGGLLDTITPTDPWDHFDVVLSTHHYVIMDVDGGVLTWTAYDLNDQVIDSFSLSAPAGVPAIGRAGQLCLLSALAWAFSCVARRRDTPPRRFAPSSTCFPSDRKPRA